MPISLGSGTVQASTPISNDDGGRGSDVFGNDTGGYDVLGTGAFGDPTGGGQVTLADISGGSSDDDAYVAALQDKVNQQVAQQQIERLRNPMLPQQVTQGFAAGTMPLSQLGARRNLQSPFPQFGLLGALNLGQRTASGIYDRVLAGGTPVYDPSGQIVGVMGQGLFGGEAYFGRAGFDPLQKGSRAITDPDTGMVIGYQAESYTGDIPQDDDGGPDIPRAPVTAITPAEEPVAAAVTPQYMQPAGGFYPSQGLYYRRGLLDEPVPGLLDFTARNQAFRRGMATDASLYQMPYDLTGYTLL